ncbi:MAG: hypothetical protein M5U05_13305 [Anaerolineales bacterium]|jgi:hypothetical protein|nr:hypothetical protein [Anaerolineales bacterium]
MTDTPIQIAGDKIRLALAGELAGKTAASATYRARFVRAGRARGAPGAELIIEAQALERAAPQFDRCAVFLDHAGLFEHPSLTRLAGVTAEPVYNPQEQALEGCIRLSSSPAGELARALIDELLAAPDRAPDLGLSIVFYGQFAPRLDPDQPRRVTAIRQVESVDLVFKPAAGGRILEKLSALNEAFNPNPAGAAPAKGANQPMQTQAEPQPITNTEPADSPAWAEAQTAAAADVLIASSGLPAPARLRLSQARYRSPAELQSAIDAERAYLATLAADRVIDIGGAAPRSPQISGGLSSLDQIGLALDGLVQGTRPRRGVQPLSGVRELYHLLSGDYEMTGVYQGERVSLANVNSSTMASLVANALNKAVMAEFQRYPQWWAPIVNPMDFDSLQAVRWTTLGGVGELPTVAEGAAYTELTWDDKYETAAFVKKGGYLGLTMEAIDKDETGRLRAAPRALAQAAWLTLSKSISSIFTQAAGAGPTLADGTALFHATRGNVGSAALSLTSWNAARSAMRKFSELHSGVRLGALAAPKYLLVPADLEITALQVIASEHDYTYALANGQAAPANVNAQGGSLAERMAFARERVIVVDLWSDANDWAAVCDPILYPTIGVGFRYGRTPEIFSVASPTAGLMFTNDTLPIKVRFVYACGAVDWRGMYKANVA